MLQGILPPTGDTMGTKPLTRAGPTCNLERSSEHSLSLKCSLLADACNSTLGAAQLRPRALYVHNGQTIVAVRFHWALRMCQYCSENVTLLTQITLSSLWLSYYYAITDRDGGTEVRHRTRESWAAIPNSSSRFCQPLDQIAQPRREGATQSFVPLCKAVPVSFCFCSREGQ